MILPGPEPNLQVYGKMHGDAAADNLDCPCNSQPYRTTDDEFGNIT
jgi:hypothetical protein